MADLPTRTALLQVFTDEVVARANERSTGQQLTAAEIFTPGSDINLIAAGTTAMGEEVVRQIGRSVLDLTIDGSEDAALDRVVADRTDGQVPRKEASQALVTLTFRRQAPGASFTYDAGSRVSTPGGIQFILTTGASFPLNALGPYTAQAKAVNAGVAGNVAAGSITRLVTAGPAGLTVTNTGPATGGDNRELDPAYRQRAKAYRASLARGTVPAIIFGALTVPGVRQASAYEERTSSGLLTGNVSLYIADANGQANSLLVAQVARALFEYRGAGIPVLIVGSIPTLIPIGFRLSFSADVDSVLAFEQVRQAVTARVNQLNPGETLRVSMLVEAARSIPGVIVPDNAVSTPAGDVVPASGQILRTLSELVTLVGS